MSDGANNKPVMYRFQCEYCGKEIEYSPTVTQLDAGLDFSPVCGGTYPLEPDGSKHTPRPMSPVGDVAAIIYAELQDRNERLQKRVLSLEVELDDSRKSGWTQREQRSLKQFRQFWSAIKNVHSIEGVKNLIEQYKFTDGG